MEGIEQRAELCLEGVPSYMWDGQSLPVPVEDIADSYVGLLIRDRLTKHQAIIERFLATATRIESAQSDAVDPTAKPRRARRVSGARTDVP